MDDNFLWPSKPRLNRARLFNLLSETVKPEYKTRNGVLDVRKFADAIEKSHECVYRWLRADYLPAKNIKAVRDACTRRMTKEMLAPYALSK